MHNQGKTFKYIPNFNHEHTTAVGREGKLQTTAPQRGERPQEEDTRCEPQDTNCICENRIIIQVLKHHRRPSLHSHCLLIICQFAHLHLF